MQIKRPLIVMGMVLLMIRALFMVFGMQKENCIPKEPLYSEMNMETNCDCVGQVYQIEANQKNQILYIQNAEISVTGIKYSKLNIVVYDKDFQKIKLGNSVYMQGRIAQFDQATNPGCFDQKKYYRNKNISFAVFPDRITVLDHQTWRLREQLHQLQKGWHQLLIRVLGEERGGVLSAMMTGEKEELNEEKRELYQVNGIGHLLAISGLHLSFVGVLFYQWFRKLGLSYTYAGIFGGTVLICYTLMTGMNISTIRAMLMFLIRIGADISGRVYDRKIALFCAAFLILFPNPKNGFDAGFLFSFGAILAICFLLPLLEMLYTKKWMKIFLASIAIQIFLFPITLYFTFEIPVYAMLLNIVVIPMMSVILGVGLFGSVMTFFIPAIGEWILKAGGILLSVYDEICKLGVKLPYARLILGQPKWQQVLLCYLMFFVLFLWKEKKKELQKGKVGIVLCAIVVLAIPWKIPGKELQITMLDIGQGDAIYMKGPAGTQYFIDGGSSDVKQVGKYRIEPYLKSQGIGELDYVFISHGDADHMNGIQEMLERQRVGIRIHNLVLPVQKLWDEALFSLAKTAVKNDTNILVIQAGDKIVEKGTDCSLLCIQPDETFDGEVGNEASMILQLSYKEFDFLLTGDVEGKGEEALVQMPALTSVDVLKVAHHGSKHSTTEEMLQIVKPKIALISAGKNNRYGHPNKETINRLKKYHAHIYSTQQSGAITIKTDGKKMVLEEYKRR